MKEEEIYKLILKFAHNWISSTSTRDELWDIVGESYILLPNLLRSYDPKKGTKLSYYIWYRLKCHFLNDLKRQHFYCYVDQEVLENFVAPKSIFDSTFILSLSDKSQVFINTLLDSSEDFEAFLQRIPKKAPLTLAQKVGRYLGLSKKDVKEIQIELVREV